METSTLDLIVAASRKAVVMVEGGAKEESESVIFEAIKLAHKECQKIIDLQEQLVKKAGKPKRTLTLVKPDEALAAVRNFRPFQNERSHGREGQAQAPG